MLAGMPSYRILECLESLTGEKTAKGIISNILVLKNHNNLCTLDMLLKKKYLS